MSLNQLNVDPFMSVRLSASLERKKFKRIIERKIDQFVDEI